MSRPAITNATLAMAILLATGQTIRADRYWALFRDGTIASADRFVDGDAWSDNAQLTRQQIFAPGNPVCTLRDNRLGLPSPAESYVLLANGDVLPGRVLKYIQSVNKHFTRIVETISPSFNVSCRGKNRKSTTGRLSTITILPQL